MTTPQKLKSGFTLVEALVAITVLLMGVLGPLSLAANGIADGLFARNQITANYLAQEAMEVVINKRYALARRAQYLPLSSDQTLFNGYVDNQFASCIGLASGAYCSVDVQDGAIISSPACVGPDYTGCQLVYNTASGLYQNPGQSSDAGPVFTRRVKINPGASSDEVKVVVTVDWYNKNTPKTLILVEHLFSQG